MIVYPAFWQEIGKVPDIQEMEDVLIWVLKIIDCKNLALSGGIDSAYMLWCMTQAFRPKQISCYTIALSEEHPDYIFSKQMTEYLGIENHKIMIPLLPLKKEDGDNPGDWIVREFFQWVETRGVNSIICCDGIDEFMGGYYSHLHNPTHETYYDFMTRLQKEQLEPLNKNSGNVNVYLPYMDRDLISLYNRFPMSDRFDTTDRKKLIKKLATGKIPEEVINRRKYGFVDAMTIKD
jgi:asparagine synthetase B (glutamine-hydrolysing)